MHGIRLGDVGYYLLLAACVLALLAGPFPGGRGSTVEAEELAGGHEAWNPVFVDVGGNEHRPVQDQQLQAVVLVFLLHDCPIANAFAPELNRLYEAFHGRGVRWLLVHADPEISAAKAQEHARQFQLQPPVLVDPQHKWVKRAGATMTPEAAVFSPTGEVLYRGRINDQYVGLGQRRTQVTSHDLREALEAILAGRPVPQPRTEAVGCFIPDPPPGE